MAHEVGTAGPLPTDHDPRHLRLDMKPPSEAAALRPVDPIRGDFAVREVDSLGDCERIRPRD